jgi:sulfite exporter TauE/SafE
METLSGFIVGLLGSLHCAGMCGPLALALPRGSGGTLAFTGGRLLYNAGRIVTYTLLGGVVGSLGKAVALAGWQQAFTVALGASLILSAVLPSFLRVLTSRITVAARAAGFLRRALSGLLGRSSAGVLFLTGIANGLLPCGFVYAALAAAAALGDTVSAALFMSGFGLGTVPVMFGISLLGPRMLNMLRGRWGKVIPVMTVMLGLLIVLRGLNLGIPWVSPHLPQESVPAAPSCH